MFGWDWGAHLPDAGIFREVSLLGMTGARLDSVYIRQTHTGGEVSLSLFVETENSAGANICYTAELTAPEGTVQTFADSPREIRIEAPKLWWPNGYGSQPLYKVKVTLFTGGMVSDTWERNIGLRTMTVKTEKDQWGTGFAHEVNGVTIFAMGADYIPEDHLLGRVTPETTRKLLEQCVAANYNAIRVWGGGYYPGSRALRSSNAHLPCPDCWVRQRPRRRKDLQASKKSPDHTFSTLPESAARTLKCSPALLSFW